MISISFKLLATILVVLFIVGIITEPNRTKKKKK